MWERSGRVGVTAAVGGIAAHRAAERGKAVYMEERIKTEETERNLRECHEVQQCEARPRAAWEPVSAGSFNVFLLFNLEAAWDEGHCILALGPVDGPLETYSYYRHSTKLEAPGIMACLRDPMTFAALEQASGWIVHGEPGNWWNEHVNCAIALVCDEVSFNGVRAYAEQRRQHPGTYNLVTYNCLTFCDDALRAGGIRLTARLLKSGKIVICKGCENAVREFSLYRWDDRAQGQDQVRKEHDHAMDEIRYFAATVAAKEGRGGMFAGCVERGVF